MNECVMVGIDSDQVVVTWLRSWTNRDALANAWRNMGLIGAADLIKALSVPSFANWRWTTLADCTKAVDSAWATFSQHFNAD
jgi:hypothetical protein